ncbi:type II toxin-antitoxin system RelE/ParE family toxin [Candidatus Saccharibacteria bacterium]|nr:type II toxin-antitoxin system RelE/ParE family toxin [Candidatus Saccharibacteria bacterium]
MPYKITPSSRFRNSFANILKYYVDILENPRIAKRVLNELEKELDVLRKYPESGAIVESPRNFTEFPIRKTRLHHYKYKVFYSFDGEDITLLDILHDLQDFERHLK